MTLYQSLAAAGKTGLTYMTNSDRWKDAQAEIKALEKQGCIIRVKYSKPGKMTGYDNKQATVVLERDIL